MGEESFRGDGTDARLPGRRQLLKGMAGVGAGCVVGQFLPGVNVLAQAEAHAADELDGLDLQTVQYPSGDGPIEAYLALPKGEAKHPAVVIIHDDAGLNESIRSLARRFAMDGFAALAPDLLSRRRGVGKEDPSEVAAAINQLSAERSVQDSQKGCSFQRAHPRVTPESVSCVGFGWGGWSNLLLAGAVDDLHSAVNFCGSTPSHGLKDVEAPMLAHYAQFDFRVTGNALWTANSMKAFGKRFTYYVYSHVNHSFFDSKSPQHDANAEKLAWARTLEFLRSPA